MRQQAWVTRSSAHLMHACSCLLYRCDLCFCGSRKNISINNGCCGILSVVVKFMHGTHKIEREYAYCGYPVNLCTLRLFQYMDMINNSRGHVLRCIDFTWGTFKRTYVCRHMKTGYLGQLPILAYWNATWNAFYLASLMRWITFNSFKEWREKMVIIQLRIN